MPRKNESRKLKSNNHHYVSADGKRTNPGTPDNPWSLSYAMRGAGKRIRPGDTVLIRGGTYHLKKGMDITLSGEADHKVTFKPCPGETVVLDGSIPEFTTTGNAAWQLFDTPRPGYNVYRSTSCYPRSESYGGFIEIDGELYSLAPHKIHSYLLRKEDLWVSRTPRYLGPGIAQVETEDCRPGHVYILIRLDNSTSTAQLQRPVPQINDPDPRHHAIFIGSSESYGMKISGSHLVFEDFDQVNNFGRCFLMSTRGQTDITFRNCGGRPIRIGMRCGSVDGLLLDSCKFHAHMPGHTWWVSYADIKAAERDESGNIPPGEPPADHVRKLALDLGIARNVTVADCLFEEFFDGILGIAPHEVEVRNTIFDHIWDDTWQMNGRHSHINFHHNFCYGAGPSVDGAGTSQANRYPGTLCIHHNVIDTTTRLLFWGRRGAPGEGIFESIPLSSHAGNTETRQYTLPRKFYYNTVVTGQTYNRNHPYVGWFLLGAKQNLISQAQHEVYNNIFLVKDGRPGGPHFDATSGQEIYDGNVYWHYWNSSPSRITSPWHQLWVGSTKDPIKDAMTVEQLRAYTYKVSHTYYAPGWENSGLSEDPKLDHRYAPQAESCKTGAVKLSRRRFPGTYPYESWRGAIPPLRTPPPRPQKARRDKKGPDKPRK